MTTAQQIRKNRDEINALQDANDAVFAAMTPDARAANRKRILASAHAAGWKTGGVQEMLNLSDADKEWIEMREALAKTLSEKRKGANLTQEQLAARVHTDQKRISKAENAHKTVSLDFMVRAIFAAGGTPVDIAAALTG